MSSVYLFRVDGAKDNDDFFSGMRPTVDHVYAGADFRVGAAGWIPDLVRVVVEEPPDRASLTLIELEATESVALISCRKYLPENSVNILSAFGEYLDRVIRQCRTSADPREREFATLKANLSKVNQVTLTTAGALRSSTTSVEELPLIDQPKIAAPPVAVNDDKQGNECVFQGVLRLDQQRAYALARCLMILDAVLRHRDHSNATFQAWRGDALSQPLKRLLTDNNGSFPALRGFLLERPSTGISLDFEKVLRELVEIWSAARDKKFDLEHTRTLISRYFPIASPIRGHEQMSSVFETARKHVAEAAI
jgi:hypothetical protein